MSKNILTLITFSIFFSISSAYADCVGNNCFCTFAEYGSPAYETGWISRCYKLDGTQVDTGLGRTSGDAIENCIVKCLHFDEHMAMVFVNNHNGKGGSRYIKKDPHDKPIVEVKPKKTWNPFKKQK